MNERRGARVRAMMIVGMTAIEAAAGCEQAGRHAWRGRTCAPRCRERPRAVSRVGHLTIDPAVGSPEAPQAFATPAHEPPFESLPPVGVPPFRRTLGNIATINGSITDHAGFVKIEPCAFALTLRVPFCEVADDARCKPLRPQACRPTFHN